jgi:hypothetical protein
MAWLTYTDIELRWDGWENFSPHPLVADAALAQAWVTALIGDAQAELEDFIPEEFQDDAAATITPASLVSAGYIRTRAKCMDWFYSTKGRGSNPEDINALLERSQKIVEQWVVKMQSDREGAGLNARRVFHKDPFWEIDQNEDVKADYDLS